jgi:hypothetical protein
LIAVEVNARRKSVVVVGDECRRRYLGGHSEREGFGECLAINIRAQIFASTDGTVALVQVKIVPAAEENVLAALVDISGSQPSVEESGKASSGKIVFAAAIAEFATG